MPLTLNLPASAVESVNHRYAEFCFLVQREDADVTDEDISELLGIFTGTVESRGMKITTGGGTPFYEE